jgi:hemerythrin-like domain-containing protein
MLKDKKEAYALAYAISQTATGREAQEARGYCNTLSQHLSREDQTQLESFVKSQISGGKNAIQNQNKFQK